MTRAETGDAGTRPILRPTTLVPLWLVGLISVWVAYWLFLWPGIVAGFGERAVALDALAKLTVWNVPVLLVLRAAGVGAAGRYLFLPGRWRAGLVWGIVAALLLSAHWIVTTATGTTSGTPIDVGTLIVDTLVAPLSEEIAFRGLLFGALADLWHSRVGAAGASSVAFAVIHLPLPSAPSDGVCRSSRTSPSPPPTACCSASYWRHHDPSLHPSSPTSPTTSWPSPDEQFNGMTCSYAGESQGESCRPPTPSGGYVDGRVQRARLPKLRPAIVK